MLKKYMNYNNTYEAKNLISKFKDTRKYGFHEGVDYYYAKGTPVTSLLDGVYDNAFRDGTYSGNMVITRHNTKFLGLDFSEDFFIYYCHLHKILLMDYNVKAGDLIGTVGNTGSCYTRMDAKGKPTNPIVWRPVSQSEKADDNCNYGVHLHLSIFQKQPKTQFSKYLLDMGYISEEDTLSQNVIFGPDKVVVHYFDPLKVFKFFQDYKDGKL